MEDIGHGAGFRIVCNADAAHCGHPAQYRIDILKRSARDQHALAHGNEPLMIPGQALLRHHKIGGAALTLPEGPLPFPG